MLPRWCVNALVHVRTGRIRNTPESDEEDDNDGSVLSLGLFPGEYLEVPGDDRCMFRFEAAWDSSLHNSFLLNRISANGEQIFMTISAYLEVIPAYYVRYPSTLKLIAFYFFWFSWPTADDRQSSRKI